MSTSRVLALSFAALAVVLLGGALLVPLAGHAHIEDAGRALYRLTCHGRPERSIPVGDATMAICARCTGIWAGMALGALSFAAGLGTRPRIGGRTMFLVALPLIVDGVTQAMGLRESTNLLRLLTGTPVGMVGILWALQYAADRSTSQVGVAKSL